MANQEQITNAILYVADDPENQHGIREMFQAQGYTVHCRNTFVSGLQFLMVQQPELLIIDNDVEGGRGLELCHTVRTDSAFHSVPILMLSRDSSQCPNEIQAFEYGVDDFIKLPMVPEVCLLRGSRLLKRDVTDALGASLSVQITSNELPGILQYVETELKTGKLNISWKDQVAVIAINQGRLASATAPGTEGHEVITETLCWPSMQVTLVEGPLEPHEILMDDQLTGIIMNCVVNVDEYHEVKRLLPSDDATFHSGRSIDESYPDQQKRIYYAALQGYSVDELIHDVDPSERRATMWLHHLIEEGCLKVGPPAFQDYKRHCHDFYVNSHLERRVTGIRTSFAQLELPLRTVAATRGVGPADWLSPVPRVMVVGDSKDHMKCFVEGLKAVYAALFGKKIPSRHLSRDTEVFRFDFGDKAAFDLIVMPSFLQQVFEVDLHEAAEDLFAVIHFASAQDRDTSRIARRIHKLMRRIFTGVYYHVVPRVPSPEGKFMFKVNCIHCGFKLAVDMDEAGFSGECPVCSKNISIPDSMDNLSHALHLSEDLPVVTIEVGDGGQVRDLMLLVFDTVLNFCSGPDQGGITDELRTEIRRLGRHSENQIEVAETQYIDLSEQYEQPDYGQVQQLGEPEAEQGYQEEPYQEELYQEPAQQSQDAFAAGFAPVPQQAAPDEEDPEDEGPAIEDILSMLNREDPVSASTIDLDQLMSDELADQGNDDDDDIDDFINSIQNQ